MSLIIVEKKKKGRYSKTVTELNFWQLRDKVTVVVVTFVKRLNFRKFKLDGITILIEKYIG